MIIRGVSSARRFGMWQPVQSVEDVCLPDAMRESIASMEPCRVLWHCRQTLE